MGSPTPTQRSRAGWHADPTDPELLRYWDGASWTSHTSMMPHGWVADGPRSADAPLPWWQRWWAVVPGLLFCAPFGLFGLWRRPGLSTGLRTTVTVATIALFMTVIVTSDDSPPNNDAQSPASAGRAASPAPTTPGPQLATSPPSPKPVKAVVPSLVGLSHKQAKRQLAKAGLLTTQIERVPSAEPRGTVLQQGTKEGKSLLAGLGVTMVVAAPYPRVPNVAGVTKFAATRALRRAGFTVQFATETVSSGRNGVVLRQTPLASDRIAPKSVVTVVIASVVRPVAPPAPPAPPAPVENCTTGYSPCLAPASDYDCAGGSGDGPAYANGPIRVTGSDPYDLDRDGDGIACET